MRPPPLVLILSDGQNFIRRMKGTAMRRNRNAPLFFLLLLAALVFFFLIANGFLRSQREKARATRMELVRPTLSISSPFALQANEFSCPAPKRHAHTRS